MKIKYILFTLALFYLVNTSYAQSTYTITTSSKWEDVTIYKSDGDPNKANTNYRNYPRISSTAWTASGYKTYWRNILKFNLTDIPTNTHILEARLILQSDPNVTSSSAYNGNSQLSGSNAFYLEEITSSWDPSTVTWNTQPSTTTSNRIWIGPSESTTENISIDISDFVVDWVQNPSANYGMLMKLENEVYYRSRNYASTNHSDSTLHPKIQIIVATEDIIADQECFTRSLDSLEIEAQPWFGNNQYLYDFMATSDYSGGTECSNCRVNTAEYRVPINAYLYHRDDGTNDPGDLTIEEIEQVIRQVNLLYEPHGIQFYLNCNINEINNTQYYEFITGWLDQNIYDGQRRSQKLMNENHTDGYINVHFIGSSDFFAGRALRPTNIIRDYSCIVDMRDSEVGGRRDLLDIVNTLAHELGHVLDLDHTHETRGLISWLGSQKNAKAGKCKQEPVTDRTQKLPCSWTSFRKCEINGDRLCDTPADPGLANSDNTRNVGRDFNSGDCWYDNRTADNDPDWDTDNWGDPWAPDVSNIMSHSLPACRNSFSPLQVAIMNINIKKFYKKYDYVDPQVEFDIYEPNNYMPNAAPVSLSQTIYGTFHWEPSDNGYENMNACDIDWYTFTLHSQQPVSIFTEAISGEYIPNTFISLFDANGTFIQSNDNGTDGKLSEIDNITLNAGQYFVQVDETSAYPDNATRGHYHFTVTTPYEIIGPDEICYNEQEDYYVQNFSSTTSTIEWSNPDAKLQLLGTTDPTVTATAVGSGTATLYATVYDPFGTTVIHKDISIISVPPKPGAISIIMDVPPGRFTASIDDVPTATSYKWYIDGVYVQTTSVGTATFDRTKNCEESYFVEVQAINGCGAGLKNYTYAYEPPCGDGGIEPMSVYPNPSSDELTIESFHSEDVSKNKEEIPHIYNVAIYDHLGNKIKEVESLGTKVKISVKDLSEGEYILHIKTSVETFKRHIQIKR